jgi:hypothetical protein
VPTIVVAGGEYLPQGRNQPGHVTWKRKYDGLLLAEMFPGERTQIQPIHFGKSIGLCN